MNTKECTFEQRCQELTLDLETFVRWRPKKGFIFLTRYLTRIIQI